MKYYVVDAFTDEVFKGNPAGVCVLDKWLQEDVMQKIAAENNLSETAFVVKGKNEYELRWFTPKAEIDLCGHATLGTSCVVSNYVDVGTDKMIFHTVSGILEVNRKSDFVSRCFYPKSGVNEDPVTGSAHSNLIPFWSKRLNKDKMIAKQLSKRGGTLYCELCGDRVKISGRASIYMIGNINI
ncbi:PhzF family phenazine biosynthesis protein [Clostridium ljungdahlii]|uniref:Putative isomerase YddE n=1 Tax=Clostridium ljungdahlii TaxID=1538 RepID=A0A166R0N4_9CLOT|nr:PhzF family phenazine biosynthesis protein [Clostridium ljungdahlii]OAA90550.1 putative isomerase YddE [Clostridium ljungdahlii]